MSCYCSFLTCLFTRMHYNRPQGRMLDIKHKKSLVFLGLCEILTSQMVLEDYPPCQVQLPNRLLDQASDAGGVIGQLLSRCGGSEKVAKLGRESWGSGIKHFRAFGLTPNVNIWVSPQLIRLSKPCKSDHSTQTALIKNPNSFPMNILYRQN